MGIKNRSYRRALLYSLLTIHYSLLLGCHSTPPPTPFDQLTPQQHLGYTAFQTHCAVCHYDRTTGDLHGPSLLGIYKKPYLHSGAPANDDRVTATVLHGRGLMPAQPGLDPQMNPDELNNLLAYLHTL